MGATVVFLGAAILGVRALTILPVGLLPRVEPPVLSVEARLPAAPAVEVDARVSGPLEERLRGVGGVRSTEARSTHGRARVTVRFGRGTDMRVARVAVREQLQHASHRLPGAVEGPRIVSRDPADRVFYRFTVVGAELSSVAAWIEDDLRRRLEPLAGVAEVRVRGAPRSELVVDVSPDRLRARALSVDDVRRSLADRVPAPAHGSVAVGNLRHPVRVVPPPSSPTSLAAVRLGAEHAVPLGAVADVRETWRPPDVTVRHDGVPAVEVELLPRPGFHLLRATRAVEGVLEAARRDRPDLELRPTRADADRVRSGVAAALAALLFGLLLIAAFLFVTLERRAAAAAGAVALPGSLLGALALFPALDIGLHLLSAVGLMTGAGLVVDNTIVVCESVARRLPTSSSTAAAVLAGTEEVAAPVTASTLTTLVVFAPLLGLEGSSGALLRDLALALCLSVAFSWLVALTLVPLLLSSAASSSRSPEGEVARWMARLQSAYEAALVRALARPSRVLCVASCLCLSGLATAALQPVGTRTLDDGAALVARLELTAGVRGEEVEETLLALERAVTASRGVTSLVTRSTPAGRPPRITVEAIPAVSGVEGRRAVRELLRSTIASTPWRRAAVPEEHGAFAALTRGHTGHVVAEVGGGSREDRARTGEALRALFREDGLLSRIRLRPRGSDPAVELVPRPGALHRHGVDAAALATLLKLHLERSGERIPSGHGRPVSLALRSAAAGASGLRRLLAVQVDGRPLHHLVDVHRTVTDRELLRRDGRPVIEVVGTPVEGSMEEAVVAATSALARASLPPGVSVRVGRSDRASRREARAMLRTAGLALLLVGVVLVVQFESLRLPLLVVSTTPFALAGAAVALASGAAGWGPAAAAGLVVTAGVTVNDAIMKVDAIRRSTDRGRSRRRAAVEAGRRRFRPIVLTTVTSVLGVLPLLVAPGPGGALRPFGLVVAGGLTAGTLASLFVLPVLAAGRR